MCRSYSEKNGGSGRVVGTYTSTAYQKTCNNFIVHHPSALYNIRPNNIIGIRLSSSANSYSNNKPKRHHHHQQQQQQQKQRGKYLDLRECNSIEEVCDMAYQRLQELNPRNLSSFWTKVSQLIVSPSRHERDERRRMSGQPQQQKLKEQMESIFIKTTDSMMTFEPRDLTQTALSIAKIVREVGNHDNIKKNNFRAGQGMVPYQEILNDIFIGQTSTHHRKEDIIFQSIADASMPNLWHFEPRFLSNLAYANAIAGSVPVSKDDGTTTLFDQIAEVSTPLLNEFNPQDLSNIVWAYEKVGATSSPLFDGVSNSILARDNLDNFPPQALSNILLAFAKVKESNPKAGETNPKLFEKVAEHIVSTYDEQLDEFTPQALANTLWAYATVNQTSPALFDTVAQHILHLHHLNSFKSQELSNIVWAYASTSNRQPLLFAKIADHILSLDNLKSFNAQNSGNILWAYATANIIHQDLFEKVAAHVMKDIDFNSLNEVTQQNLLRASEKAQRVVNSKKALGKGIDASPPLPHR